MFSLRIFKHLISNPCTKKILKLHSRLAPLRTLLTDPALISPLILIYQMQKAGSQTLEATLQKANLPAHIFRFHFLTPSRAAVIHRFMLSHNIPDWQQKQQYQLDMAARVRPIVETRSRLGDICKEVRKINIITGLREPIGCTLSWIFQNYFLFFPRLESVTPAMAQKAVMNAEPLGFFKNWFDSELKTTIGIDVYQALFPTDQGYAIYENHFARVLVYRFEALSKLPALLSQFLGYPIPELVNRNVGSAKVYAEVYQRIIQNLHFPADFVDAQYNSNMMRHFYSEEERAALARRWTMREPAMA